MKKKMRSYFFLLNLAQSLYMKLLAIQRDMAVDEYTVEFHHHISMNGISRMEDQLVSHYVHGF